MATDLVPATLTVREIRLRLHAQAVELGALAAHLSAATREVPYDHETKLKSPFSHRSSRSLWQEAFLAKLRLGTARKMIHMVDAGLRHLDDERPRLPHLKRLTRRNDRHV